MAVPNSKNDDALLKNLVPLNTLSDEQLGVLLSRVKVEKAKKGMYLFREGDTDHQNIYLLQGTIALLSGQKEMDLVSSGTQTARFALAHQLPRKHSAQARTAVTFVRIDSRMLSDMLARSHSAGYEVNDIEQPAGSDWMSLLLQSPVFQQIPPANLQRVMMRMEEVIVKKGEIVIRQGDEGDYFYLISEGEVSVSRSPEANHAPVELAKLRVGKGFGEEALISNKPRSSTVAMLTDGVLVRLNKQDFIELVKQPLSRTIDYENACKEVEAGALWIDVRTPEEYEAGHLPGAINLPFFSLRFQASSLSMDRPYMVYGVEVGQSTTAAYLLTERGAEVLVLDMDWIELAGASGLNGQAEDVAPVSNVIDFNRDAEDSAAQARLQEDADSQEVKALKQALAEKQLAFEEELKQRQLETKLLKQALAVAKQQSKDDAQQSQETQDLAQEVDRLHESLSRAEVQLSEAGELKQDLLQAQAHSTELESKLAELQEELAQTCKLRDEFRQQSIELQTKDQKTQKRYDAQEGALKEEITELRFQLESAAETAEQLQKKSTELEALKAEMNDLDERSEAYRKQAAEELARISAERFDLESSLHQLQAQQDADEVGKSQKLVELQRSLDEMRQELESARGEFQQQEAAWQAKQEEANQVLLEAQEQSSNEKLLLEQQINSLQQEIEKQHSSSQVLQQELEQARQTNNEQCQARQQVESELQQTAEEQTRFDAMLGSLNKELQAARNETNQQREKRIEMEAMLEQEYQTTAFLRRSLKTAEEAVEVSDEQFTETEEVRKALEVQLGELQQVLEQSQQLKAEQEQHIEQLRTELDQLKGQLEQAVASGQQEQQKLSAIESVRSELEHEKQQLKTRLDELQSESSTQIDSLKGDLKARRQEIEQLHEALSTAQAAASETAADQTELELARQARQEAEAKITALNREVEGLREVQLEMESQLSDDVDNEINSLRGALEAEERKRRDAEQKAQKADVLRREREMQDTAVDMLNEEMESLVKEKDDLINERDKLTKQLQEREKQDSAVAMLNEEMESLAKEKGELANERDKLKKQLREIRVQYTDLVNENDQLHSEMSGFANHTADSHIADDLLTQIEELRGKAERYERERDQARSDAFRMRREVGELRSVIETYVEQIQDVQSFGLDDQVVALRAELDMVRRQAHEDLEAMRRQLYEAEARLSDSDSRDVDFVADQQATRQEMVSLQHALNEKDHLLRQSQNQCRSLEDAVEDRDKEVDQLKRKLELLLRKTGGMDDSSMRLGSRSFPDSAQRDNVSMEGENDSGKSGLGRLFRKK
jgi:CRP-like cAMP-binding protein/chromosome segregation ATPase